MLSIWHNGQQVAEAKDPGVPLTNLACAIAMAIECGVAPETIATRLSSLPTPDHRQSVQTGPDGLTVIDDTYNANPASMRRGLELLEKYADSNHRRVVATPGMVELGNAQRKENADFARKASEIATDLVIIGRTNRKALVVGAQDSDMNVVIVDRLPQAVAWMREHIGDGDAVLYANDLPDHYA